MTKGGEPLSHSATPELLQLLNSCFPATPELLSKLT
jgi:hypothetical protein